MKRHFCILFATVLLAFAQLAGNIACSQSPAYLPLADRECAGISDLILIYQGGNHRPEWTAEQFQPYVSWTSPRTGRAEWLFDGFLFLELWNGKDRDFAAGYGRKPARKEEWEWYLDRLFTPGRALAALNAQCETVSRSIGEPARKRQVVIMIPEPIQDQTDWGDVAGTTMDFQRNEHRLAACRWYFKEVQRRWTEAKLSRLELAGLYWLSEHTQHGGAELLPSVAREIRQYGWKFFWIPYWKAPGAEDWRRLGFNAAYQQPNYFFNPLVPAIRFEQALGFARKNGMGVEMEWDHKIFKDPETFVPRMEAYLESFRKAGADQAASMAHYEGGGALMQLAKSTNPDERELYREYCETIARRQRQADMAVRPVARPAGTNGE